MKVDAYLTLEEMHAALLQAAQRKLYRDCEIGDVYVTSYENVKIRINQGGIVECEKFRHRSHLAREDAFKKS